MYIDAHRFSKPNTAATERSVQITESQSQSQSQFFTTHRQTRRLKISISTKPASTLAQFTRRGGPASIWARLGRSVANSSFSASSAPPNSQVEPKKSQNLNLKGGRGVPTQPISHSTTNPPSRLNTASQSQSHISSQSQSQPKPHPPSRSLPAAAGRPPSGPVWVRLGSSVAKPRLFRGQIRSSPAPIPSQNLNLTGRGRLLPFAALLTCVGRQGRLPLCQVL